MSDGPLFLGVSCIAAARAADLRVAAENNVWLVPDMFVSWDAEQAEVSLDVVSEPGEIVRIDARVGGEPRWITLNFALGTAAFEADGVMAIVTDMRPGATARMQPKLRSTMGDETGDTDFAEALGLPDRPPVGAAMHSFAAGDHAVRGTAQHLLILSLPLRDFHLALRDIAVFYLPPAAGLRSAPRAFGDLAV